MHITNEAITNIKKELVRRQKIYEDCANNYNDDPKTNGFYRGKAAAMDDMFFLLERSMCNE